MTNGEKLARLNLFLSGVVDQLEEIKKDFCKEPREFWIVVHPNGTLTASRTYKGLGFVPKEVIHVREVMDEQTAN